VQLMPAQYVKAYVKRNKNDTADAAAICQAVGRPSMRFAAIKTAEQQAALLLRRGRERLVRQRTSLVNALRAHLAEFGVNGPQELRNVACLDPSSATTATRVAGSGAPSAASARHPGRAVGGGSGGDRGECREFRAGWA
jgi:transposase